MNLRSAVVLGIGSLATAVSLNGAIVIYADGYQNGWTASQWDMTTTTTVTHNGSARALSAQTPTNGATKIGVQNPGLMVGDNTLLEFWMNSNDGLQTGSVTILLNWGGAINPPYTLDTRNYSTRSYELDGVPTLIASVKTDANGVTWQKVRVDLTEKIYTGWPYVEHQWNPAVSTLSYLGINSGTKNLVVDDIQLVAIPEPATIVVAAIPALGSLMRRRR